MADDNEDFAFEFQRNFEVMNDLDQRTEEMKAHIENLATEYMNRFHDLSSEERVAILKQIHEGYGKWKEYSEDKVEVAAYFYMVVDKHIQQLEKPVTRLEADLEEEEPESSEDDSSCSESEKRGDTPKEKTPTPENSQGQDSDEETLEPAKKKLRFLLPPTVHEMPSWSSDSESPFDLLDICEPHYVPTTCLCHQAAYGEMVVCDNPDCIIERFHFACVGLTTKPEGKWFCPSCSEGREGEIGYTVLAKFTKNWFCNLRGREAAGG